MLMAGIAPYPQDNHTWISHQRRVREVRKVQDGRPQATAQIAAVGQKILGRPPERFRRLRAPEAAVIAVAGWFYGEMMKMQEERGLIEPSKHFRNDVELEVQKLFS